jgi:hypothetical protein
MPSLPFFADAGDLGLLVQHLSEDPEVAFLVSVPPIGPLPPLANRIGNPTIEGQRWQAVRSVTSLGDGQHLLWHVPAGDLCENAPSPTLVLRPGTPIADPWSGWTGRSIVLSMNMVIPDVESGPGGSGIVSLDLTTRYRQYSAEERAAGGIFVSYWTGQDMLVCSSFSWIGSRYEPAAKVTSLWWNRLKRGLGRAVVKLTDPTGRQAFYAFPSALRRLQSGIKYTAFGWNIDASIQAAPGLRGP